MKLTNPTDEALNAAFAVEVAGWKFIQCRYIYPEAPPEYNILASPREAPNFTGSADLVLPLLEKFNGPTNGPEISFCMGTWEVVLNGTTTRDRAVLGSFSKAAVIALLRAHGVEIEFT